MKRKRGKNRRNKKWEKKEIQEEKGTGNEGGRKRK